jgi:hypothetical protein
MARPIPTDAPTTSAIALSMLICGTRTRTETAPRQKSKGSAREGQHWRAPRKRCRASTLRDVMKIVPPVVLEEGRQGDGKGVGISGRSYDRSYGRSQSAHRGDHGSRALPPLDGGAETRDRDRELAGRDITGHGGPQVRHQQRPALYVAATTAVRRAWRGD